MLKLRPKQCTATDASAYWILILCQVDPTRRCSRNHGTVRPVSITSYWTLKSNSAVISRQISKMMMMMMTVEKCRKMGRQCLVDTDWIMSLQWTLIVISWHVYINADLFQFHPLTRKKRSWFRVIWNRSWIAIHSILWHKIHYTTRQLCFAAWLRIHFSYKIHILLSTLSIQSLRGVCRSLLRYTTPIPD